jgi:hypothetical protein
METTTIPPDIRKEIGRLRSEVRKLEGGKLQGTKQQLSVVSGNYWTQTGMPWVAGEGRKAVLTEIAN